MVRTNKIKGVFFSMDAVCKLCNCGFEYKVVNCKYSAQFEQSFIYTQRVNNNKIEENKCHDVHVTFPGNIKKVV